MMRLTNSAHLPANLSKEDFEKRIVSTQHHHHHYHQHHHHSIVYLKEVSRLVGNFMDPKGANSQGWQLMNKDNDEVRIDVKYLFPI